MSAISTALDVSRSNLYERSKTSLRKKRYDMREDEYLLPRIKDIIEKHQTYGYRRVTVLLNRMLTGEGKKAVNHKRVYRIMHQNALLLVRNG